MARVSTVGWGGHHLEVAGLFWFHLYLSEELHLANAKAFQLQEAAGTVFQHYQKREKKPSRSLILPIKGSVEKYPSSFPQCSKEALESEQGEVTTWKSGQAAGAREAWTDNSRKPGLCLSLLATGVSGWEAALGSNSSWIWDRGGYRKKSKMSLRE